MSNLPGGQIGFLIVVNIFIFFLAFFLDFFEIAFIILPLLGPVAEKLGINGIWFGVLLCVNMQTSFMHPPFGFALFYLRGIADTLFKNGALPKKIESTDIYMGAIPWVVMQLILVVIVIFVPQTVTVFLDKEVTLDLDKANDSLRDMSMGRASQQKPASTLIVPGAASGAGTGTSTENEDPMAAILRANEQDKQKKP